MGNLLISRFAEKALLSCSESPSSALSPWNRIQRIRFCDNRIYEEVVFHMLVGCATPLVKLHCYGNSYEFCIYSNTSLSFHANTVSVLLHDILGICFFSQSAQTNAHRRFRFSMSFREVIFYLPWLAKDG